MSAVSEFQTTGAEQQKAQSAKLVLVVGLQTRGVAEERSDEWRCEHGCDGWGRPGWKCGGSCTSGRLACNQSVVEPGANAAAGGVAEMAIVWHSDEPTVAKKQIWIWNWLVREGKWTCHDGCLMPLSSICPDANWCPYDLTLPHQLLNTRPLLTLQFQIQNHPLASPVLHLLPDSWGKRHSTLYAGSLTSDPIQEKIYHECVSFYDDF